MRNVAKFRFDVGRKEEGLGTQEELLALRRKVLGPEHPDTIHSMSDLANFYADTEIGRRDDGLNLSEEVLAVRTRLLGPEHPDTSLAREILASFYINVGRLDEALALVGRLPLLTDSPAAAAVLVPPTSEWR